MSRIIVKKNDDPENSYTIEVLSERKKFPTEVNLLETFLGWGEEYITHAVKAVRKLNDAEFFYNENKDLLITINNQFFTVNSKTSIVSCWKK